MCRNHQFHLLNQFAIQMYKNFSVACSYGCKHEDAARKEYIYEMKKKYSQFTITELGLVLDPLYPFLGAIPDGLISCNLHT